MFNKNKIMKLMLILGFATTCMLQAYALIPVKINPFAEQAQKVASREIVVLVHGLMRTSLSMAPLKFYLQRHGYEVRIYSYPSPRYSIHQHAQQLNYFIKQLEAENPGVKIHFVTHSMGGIITREALSRLSKKEFNQIGYLVMMAPPNQGSKLAKLSTNIFPILKSMIKPLSELSSEHSAYVHRVPIPPLKMGIIAGRYDAKVPPEAARMDGFAEPIVISTTHTFIMNHPEAKKLIVTFLEKGTFKGKQGQ
ncbi:esterase/lipase family protein [Legionella sp.]|uniref:esterase/lipase family protein n=1 Tax=Legionella sp. TaxID=459 RepID=UPI0039E24C77